MIKKIAEIAENMECCDYCGKDIDEVRKHHVSQKVLDDTEDETPICSKCGKMLCLDCLVIYKEMNYISCMTFGCGASHCWTEEKIFRCHDHKITTT